MHRFTVLAALVAATVLAFFAASADASVSGYTYGTSGRVVSYATVHIHNNATGANGSTSSGYIGSYYFSGTTANTSYTLYACKSVYCSSAKTVNTGSGNNAGANLYISGL